MSLKPWFQKASDQITQEELARMTRQQAFDRGLLSVSDLDDEELRAGRCRGPDGNIPKIHGKTQTIPRDIFDDVILEHESRTNQRLRERMDTMIDVITEVALDPTVEPRDRVDAAKYIFERVAGKTPERVHVVATKAPWEEMLGGIARITREQSRGIREGIIDAEILNAESVDVADAEANEPGIATESGNIGDAGDGIDKRTTTSEDEDGFAPTVVPRSEFEYTYPTATPVESHTSPGNTSATIPSAGPPDSESWADLVAKQKELAERRKEARKRISNATKARKVARATGADVYGNKRVTTHIDSEDADGNVQVRFDFE